VGQSNHRRGPFCGLTDHARGTQPQRDAT
jgi:hypothetical protein